MDRMHCIRLVIPIRIGVRGQKQISILVSTGMYSLDCIITDEMGLTERAFKPAKKSRRVHRGKNQMIEMIQSNDTSIYGISYYLYLIY